MQAERGSIFSGRSAPQFLRTRAPTERGGTLLADGAIYSVAQSARGLAHSKTLRVFSRMGRRASVLECACPLALSRANATQF